MVTATKMDTLLTLSDGSTPKEKSTTSNITIRLVKESKTSLLLKLLHKETKILNGAQMIFTTRLQRAISPAGIGSFKLCQRRMQRNIDSMYLM